MSRQERCKGWTVLDRCSNQADVRSGFFHIRFVYDSVHLVSFFLFFLLCFFLLFSHTHKKKSVRIGEYCTPQSDSRPFFPGFKTLFPVILRFAGKHSIFQVFQVEWEPCVCEYLDTFCSSIFLLTSKAQKTCKRTDSFDLMAIEGWCPLQLSRLHPVSCAYTELCLHWASTDQHNRWLRLPCGSYDVDLKSVYQLSHNRFLEQCVVHCFGHWQEKRSRRSATKTQTHHTFHHRSISKKRDFVHGQYLCESQELVGRIWTGRPTHKFPGGLYWQFSVWKPCSFSSANRSSHLHPLCVENSWVTENLPCHLSVRKSTSFGIANQLEFKDVSCQKCEKRTKRHEVAVVPSPRALKNNVPRSNCHSSFGISHYKWPSTFLQSVQVSNDQLTVCKSFSGADYPHFWKIFPKESVWLVG